MGEGDSGGVRQWWRETVGEGDRERGRQTKRGEREMKMVFVFRLIIKMCSVRRRDGGKWGGRGKRGSRIATVRN